MVHLTKTLILCLHRECKSLFTYTKPYVVLFGDVNGDRGIEASSPVTQVGKKVLLFLVHCEVKLLASFSDK